MGGCNEVVGLMGGGEWERGGVERTNKAKNRNNINRGRRNSAKSSHTAFIAFDRLFLVCSFTQVRRV
ncbi:hypothetical protein ACLB2K_047209 [Fragaria x ananassa]